MAKSNIINDNRFLNSVNIGLILKAQREHLNLSQKEVADRLGYRNYNYISMIERGTSTISLPKIMEIISAYELSSEFGLVVLKGLYPEFYEIMFDLIGAVGAKSMDETNVEVQKIMIKYLKDFGIKPKDSIINEKVFPLPRRASS